MDYSTGSRYGRGLKNIEVVLVSGYACATVLRTYAPFQARRFFRWMILKAVP